MSSTTTLTATSIASLHPLEVPVGTATATATPNATDRGLVHRRVIPKTTFLYSTSSSQEERDEEFASSTVLEQFHNEAPDVLKWEKVEPQVYKRKPKNIRRFYKQQNLLIDRLQAFYNAVPSSEDEAEAFEAEPAVVGTAIHASFGLNLLLLAAKIIASILSGSMSVIASAADSLLDLLSGTVLVITHRLMNKSDTLHYPQGKSRMEPIGVFSFAIIMMLSSLQIMIEAVRRLVSRPPPIDIGPFTLAILGFTIVSKAAFCWYCRKVAREFKSGAAEAYADDHRNDVMTNVVGVGAALAAYYVPSLWFFDSTGAIRIAIYIIYNWLITGNEQLHFLTGRGASSWLLQQLTYISANHDPRIKYVDTVRAYHFGANYLVEIDIVLPEDMALKESHDIGESLQHRLEQLEDVERAFVHNDYEWDHSPVVLRGNHIIRK